MNAARLVISFVVFQLISTCFGQQTRPQFTLGMTIDELHQRFGMPTRYYDHATERYLATEAEAKIARKVSEDSDVEDVYEIKTAFNTYEFQVVNYYDESQSHLHPTKRFVRVTFQLDKPVEDVKVLLADLPEAVGLCSLECTIFRQGDEYTSRLIVQPTRSSPDELKEAGLMARGWRDDEKPKEAWDWVKGFEFEFERAGFGKRIESGTFELMVKGKGYHIEPLTRIGVWRSPEQKP